MSSGSQHPTDICERTFEFAARIVKLCQTLTKRPAPEEGRLLAKQLFRAGTSIGANTEEAQASQSKADFIAKISIACKEARETLYWLRLLARCEIIPKKRLERITDEANQLTAILTAIIRKSRNNPE